MHLDAFALGQREASLRFEKSRIDRLRGEGVVDDVRSAGERRIYIAAGYTS
jgi:hypothetical protein